MRKHRAITIILGLLALLGCATTEQHKETNSIQGSWVLQDQDAINYPQIIFNKDSTAIFKSKGDTIYRFTYFLQGANLILQDNTGNQEIYEILRLSRDSLVFNSLRENRSHQIYIKE